MKYLFAILSLSVGLLSSCTNQEKAQDSSQEALSNDTVVMTTSLGEITIKLDPEKAPITVANFLKYVDRKDYDGTVYHRTMRKFMIQGGGYSSEDGELVQRPTDAPIKNEASNGLLNLRGTIAMARRPHRDSATNQFFINLKHNDFLDGDYTVFGEVLEGIDVVDAIVAKPTTRKTLVSVVSTGSLPIDPSPTQDIPEIGTRERQIKADIPVEDIVILSIRRAAE